MFSFQMTEHDEVLLKIASQAASTKGLDSEPDSSALRSALAVEDYTEHRTIAAIIKGLHKKGMDVDERTVLAAFVDGKQDLPNVGFESPLLKGKKYEV